MSRYHSPFSRDVSVGEDVSPRDQKTSSSWYDEFVSNLQKQSVQPRQPSIHDEIYSIMHNNSKSKYSSVEEVVQDLKQRTGLQQFLDEQKKAKYSQEDIEKAAQANNSKTMAVVGDPEIFKTIPEMKVFIDNFVADRPGTTIESVVHDLLKMDSIYNKLPDKSDVSPDVRAYINKKIVESQANMSHQSNNLNMDLGKVEVSNDVDDNNPLDICEPATAGIKRLRFIK